MRTKILAALSVTTLTTLTTLLLSACGGDAPPPVAPPPPPPPPADTASAAPAPTDTTPPAPPPKPALSDVIPTVLKGLSDAFNAHDAQKFGSYFTDDTADYSYGTAMPESHSRGDLQTGIGGLFAAFPDATMATTRAWIKGNVVVWEMLWTGTNKGDMGPMKATNKPVGAVHLNVMWFTDDGLVKETHEYGDGAGFLMQLAGAKNAPPIPTLPTNPPEIHVAKGTPDEDALGDWAKSIDVEFSKDDPKAAVATWAADGDLLTNLGGPAIKGTKDLTKEMTSWMKAFPDQKWTSTNAWGIDGFAIIEHTVSGTNKGALGKLPASGKPVQSWHWVDILQPSADKKVQHDWAFANMNEELKQTGQFKMPGDGGKGAKKK